jgi:hypothetical protein
MDWRWVGRGKKRGPETHIRKFSRGILPPSLFFPPPHTIYKFLI